MLCFGDGCSKSKECGRCIQNLSEKYLNQKVGHTIENLSTFGSGSACSDGSIRTEYMCGENGGYKQFEPVTTGI